MSTCICIVVTSFYINCKRYSYNFKTIAEVAVAVAAKNDVLMPFGKWA
jgi:hypothetical protein